LFFAKVFRCEEQVSLQTAVQRIYPLEGSENVLINIGWWVNWRAPKAKLVILRRILETVRACTIRPSSIL
jgi:hypothetical protein